MLFHESTLWFLCQERWAATLHEQQHSHSAGEVLEHPASRSYDSFSVSDPPPADCSASTAREPPTHTPAGEGSGGEAAVAVRKPAAAAAAEAVAKGAAQIFHYPSGQLRTVAAFDITARDVPMEIAAKGSGNFVLLIFVLSALHPRDHAIVARRCAEVSCVIFLSILSTKLF